MKRLAIIGGGISGLAALHYLKKRFAKNIEITLFERESIVGGTIHTLKNHGCLFETGPNGFLNHQSSTFELIQDLGLTPQLIEANPNAKRRYIQIREQLYQLPTGPISFITTPLLSFKDKWAMIQGIFKKNISTDQSIYDYVTQRFNSNIAQCLADPFITGIYAGDIKRLHMASAFPQFGNKAKRVKKHKTLLYSFKKGMGQCMEALYTNYQEHIRTGQEINSLDNIDADIIILATPAYVTNKIIEGRHPRLTALLEQIHYAPVALAGLVFPQDSFRQLPDGFGYLVSSQESKDILGVLIESSVYADRAPQGLVMIRVMLGGMHHPAIINDNQEQILSKANKEINTVYGLNSSPVQTFVKLWPKGIPQYDLNYPLLRKHITEELKKTPNLYLCANYLDGISFNDCINNAKSIANTILI